MHRRATLSGFWRVPGWGRPKQPRLSNPLRDGRDHAAVERVAMCVWIEVERGWQRVSPQKQGGPAVLGMRPAPPLGGS